MLRYLEGQMSARSVIFCQLGAEPRSILLDCNGMGDGMRHHSCPDATPSMTDCNAKSAVMQRISPDLDSNHGCPIIVDTIPYTYTYKGRVGG